MRQRMRTLALASAVALLAVGPGCFVMDELDSGMELMKENAPQHGKKSQEPVEEAPATARKKDGKRLDLAAWWKSARTPSSGPKDPRTALEVVRCRIGSDIRFMSKTDCQVQGGHF